MIWYTFGIIATALLGLFNLWYTFHNNQRTSYINSVTAERVKWINSLRKNLSKFAGLVFHYAELGHSDPKGEEWHKLLREADHLRMLLKLQLNPTGEPDRQIEALLDLAYTPNAIQSPEHMQNLIHDLIRLGQKLLKQEWEKVKQESKYGDLRGGWLRSFWEEQIGCGCQK